MRYETFNTANASIACPILQQGCGEGSQGVETRAVVEKLPLVKHTSLGKIICCDRQNIPFLDGEAATSSRVTFLNFLS
jgi:hypothetical protein